MKTLSDEVNDTEPEYVSVKNPWVENADVETVMKFGSQEVVRIRPDGSVWINPEIKFENLEHLGRDYLLMIAGFCWGAAQCKTEKTEFGPAVLERGTKK